MVNRMATNGRPPSVGDEPVPQGGLSFEPPKWKLLKVEWVKSADYNPTRRSEPRRIRELVKSIADVGLLYPILVDERSVVIDGHRRLAAVKELGWETVPAIVLERDRDHLYASVNVTAVKMTGNDSLSAWLICERAVSPLLAKRFREMETEIGVQMVRIMCEKGHSARTYGRAKQAATYCGVADNLATVKQILRWIMDVAMQSTVLEAMRSGIRPQAILSAVEKMKPLRLVSAGDN